jgi:hypothetical protein
MRVRSKRINNLLLNLFSLSLPSTISEEVVRASTSPTPAPSRHPEACVETMMAILAYIERQPDFQTLKPVANTTYPN